MFLYTFRESLSKTDEKNEKDILSLRTDKKWNFLDFGNLQRNLLGSGPRQSTW